MLPMDKPLAATVTQQVPEVRVCSACGTGYRIGELVCSKCNAALTDAVVTLGKTRKVGRTNRLMNWKLQSCDNHLVINPQIVFHIDDRELALPTAPLLTIGRTSAMPSDACPDVDLSAYQAIESGVSRRHIRISRNMLIYIADLGSSNGSFINGQRLFPNTDYVVSDGDELRLGRLRIKIELRKPVRPEAQSGIQ